MNARIRFSLNDTRRHAGTLAVAVAVAAVALLSPELALAQLSDKPVRMANDIAALLQAMGIAIFTGAALYGAYQVVFEGAQFRNLSKLFWGGAIAGMAGTIAGWAMGA